MYAPPRRRIGLGTVLAGIFFLGAVGVLAAVLIDRGHASPAAVTTNGGTNHATTTRQSTMSTTTRSTTTTASTTTTTTPKTVTVPSVVGEQRSAAQAAIHGAGLVSEFKGVPSTKPEGTVLGESPPAGSTGKQGDHVYMTIASGAKPHGSGAQSTTTASTTTTTTAATVQVPTVTGLQRDAAQAAIHAAGLVSEVKGVPSNLPEGTVLGQSPSAGSSVASGSHVYMTVASGAKPKSHGNDNGNGNGNGNG